MAEVYKSVTELMKTARGNKALQSNLGDITDFQQIIDDTPTTDVVEVKHGKWIDDIQKFSSPAGVTQKYLVGYKCSLCGRTERIKEPYCNCGAKMDGQRKNDFKE